MQSLAQTLYGDKSPDDPTAADAQARADYRADRQRHTPPPTKHYADATGRVLLGARALADAQRALEDEAGGLVAYLFRR